MSERTKATRQHIAEVALYSFLAGAVGVTSIAQKDWWITAFVAVPLFLVAVSGIFASPVEEPRHE